MSRLTLLLALALLVGCTSPRQSQVPTAAPTTAPAATASGERHELRFAAADGVRLAGELATPSGAPPYPLVVIIHHAGPVARDAYAYMAPLLLARGYAVFRFDKRGTGASAGAYGCCEGDDALAAYSAVVREPKLDLANVFIVAQSVGTEELAERFPAFVAAQPPRAVALLSNRLKAAQIRAIAAPALIVVADSEPELAAIGPEAAKAHAAALAGSTELYIAEGAEHSLFDISAGPIDWSDPSWAQHYHRGAMTRLLDWLDSQRTPRAAFVP